MWQCGNCNAEVEDDLDLCWKCGTGKDGSPPEDPEAFAGNRQDAIELELDPGDGTRPNRRPHSFFAFVSDALMVLAAIVAVVVIIALVGNAKGWNGGVPAMLSTFVGGGLLVLLIVAVAAILRLALDIEWNTRPRE